MAKLHDLLLGYEKIVIIKTLQANKFNVSVSSGSLGISRQALYRRILKLRVDITELRALDKEARNGFRG